MEIRMVKCPKCQAVYNEALNMGCPQCAGTMSRGSGFSKTVMPGMGAQQPVQQINTPTAAPVSPVEQVSAFPKTTPPAFAGAAPQNTAAVGVFTKTQPPGDNRFVHTQYIGENATVKADMRVAGWIVQIDGVSPGKDYRIHAGYNYIGRQEGDIRIEGDDYISSVKDSQIYYDSVTTTFYVAHVNGANAVRVNGEPVISGSQKLKAYDILMIGKTRFVFVPLCSEKFNWEEE